MQILSIINVISDLFLNYDWLNNIQYYRYYDCIINYIWHYLYPLVLYLQAWPPGKKMVSESASTTNRNRWRKIDKRIGWFQTFVRCVRWRRLAAITAAWRRHSNIAGRCYVGWKLQWQKLGKYIIYVIERPHTGPLDP